MAQLQALQVFRHFEDKLLFDFGQRSRLEANMNTDRPVALKDLVDLIPIIGLEDLVGIFTRWLVPLALVSWLVWRSTKPLRLRVKDHVDDIRVPTVTAELDGNDSVLSRRGQRLALKKSLKAESGGTSTPNGSGVPRQSRFKKDKKRYKRGESSVTQSLGRISRLTSSGIKAGISSCADYMRKRGSQISQEDEESFSWFKHIFLFVLLTIYRLAFVKTLSAPAKDKLRSQGENVKPYVPRKTLVDLLSRVKFANWAYWQEIPNRDALLRLLRPFGFTYLHRYHTVSEPGRVGGYVAYNHDDKVVMIVARGSCTLSDFATDIAGLPVQQYDSESHLYEMRTIFSHEGILKASNKFYEEHEDILLAAAETGYKVEIIGHSLGAAVASVVAGFAASRIPILQEEGRLRAFAFACPPCLNEGAAIALEPFVTNVIWNNDIVPSAGVDGFLSVCKLAACILSEKAESYKKRGHSLFQILGSVGSMLLLHCFGYGEPQSEEEKEAEQTKIQDLLWKIHKEKKEEVTSLYVPGRVVHLWERTHFGKPTGQVNGCIAHGTSFLHLAFSVLTWGCIGDHTLPSYEEGIQRMLDRIGKETEHSLRSFTSKRSLLSDLSNKPVAPLARLPTDNSITPREPAADSVRIEPTLTRSMSVAALSSNGSKTATMPMRTISDMSDISWNDTDWLQHSRCLAEEGTDSQDATNSTADGETE